MAKDLIFLGPTIIKVHQCLQEHLGVISFSIPATGYTPMGVSKYFRNDSLGYPFLLQRVSYRMPHTVKNLLRIISHMVPIEVVAVFETG